MSIPGTEAAGRSVLDRDPAWSGPVDDGAGPGPDGVWFEPVARHVDARGWFVKPFQASAVERGGGDAAVAEVFVSSSHRGVVRGLHFQEPPADHAKTVTCLSGVIYDVVVDLRGGPADRRVAGYRLDGDAPARLHLPSGVAHGFQALTDDAVVLYVTSTEHDPGRDAGVRFDSAGVTWPLPAVAVSERDPRVPRARRLPMAGVSAAAPVLVTGATGFVGRHLVRRLLADRQPVVALVRDPRHLDAAPGLTTAAVPATDAELRALVEAHRPAACVHLATHFVAAREVDDLGALVDANITFGLRVAEACLAADGVPFVDTGTVWQHAGGAVYAPVNLYAATKQAFHDLLVDLAARGLPVATLVLTDTYGPDDDRTKLVPLLRSAARSGEPLALGEGQGRVDLVHVDDVVAAFRLLVERLTDPVDPLSPAADVSTIHTLGSGAPCTVRELVALADRALGRPVPVAWGARPDRPADREPPVPHHPPLPGWAPTVTLAEGLDDLFGPLRDGACR